MGDTGTYGARTTRLTTVRDAGRTRRRAPAGRRAKPRWYLPAVLGTDAVVTAVSVALVLDRAHQPHPLRTAAVATVAWISVRALRHRYRTGDLGESRGAMPVLHDWLILVASLAVLGVATARTPQPYPALAALLPCLVAAVVCHRRLHRHLTAARRAAEAVDRVLVVGEPGVLEAAVHRLASRTDHPYAVVGTVVAVDDPLAGVPGALAEGALAAAAAGSERLDPGLDGRAAGHHVVEAARRHDAELVLLAPGASLTGDRLRELCWVLHDAGLEVALTPGLVETSVKRLTAASVAGLTVLRVEPPLRHGAQAALKSTVDRCGAALGLLLLAPLLLLLAALIRLDSPGPALYRQVRVGRDQRTFTMWKFRSMVTDADSRKDDLATRNECDGLMFKMRRDPRVTRVGRFLRRTSLDELPQLVNVVRGDMSLVGPRPPLPDEVAAYDATALRRLRVKPGMTGLWQVSGRSDLSWDETVQLDLHYVDNWSFSSDLDVMSRTLRAVVDGRGAY
ncbi:sugar transferase [Streptomyces thermolilacinus]|uniref:sugar transferase n=1 Tax=Streptomyces thermolilacinus TaxID=285540 RepID=UPI0003C75B84|nr:sugar transferase [Streptomyces thermolilacinus]